MTKPLKLLIPIKGENTSFERQLAERLAPNQPRRQEEYLSRPSKEREYLDKGLDFFERKAEEEIAKAPETATPELIKSTTRSLPQTLGYGGAYGISRGLGSALLFGTSAADVTRKRYIF